MRFIKEVNGNKDQDIWVSWYEITKHYFYEFKKCGFIKTHAKESDDFRTYSDLNNGIGYELKVNSGKYYYLDFHKGKGGITL